MAQPSVPPPSRTLLAAAAGGFGGAVLGVVAATSLMGEPEGGNKEATSQVEETPAAEIAVAER